jgi:hypothetical protein
LVDGRGVRFETLSAVSDPYARIFLLSHMRAFISLAGHILGSHPQINGYCVEARVAPPQNKLELIRQTGL